MVQHCKPKITPHGLKLSFPILKIGNRLGQIFDKRAHSGIFAGVSTAVAGAGESPDSSVVGMSAAPILDGELGSRLEGESCSFFLGSQSAPSTVHPSLLVVRREFEAVDKSGSNLLMLLRDAAA
jgi:hypothetical protein